MEECTALLNIFLLYVIWPKIKRLKIYTFMHLQMEETATQKVEVSLLKKLEKK